MVAGNKGRVVTWMDAISQARGWAPYALFFCCFCSTKMQYYFCLQMKSKGGGASLSVAAAAAGALSRRRSAASTSSGESRAIRRICRIRGHPLAAQDNGNSFPGSEAKHSATARRNPPINLLKIYSHALFRGPVRGFLSRIHCYSRLPPADRLFVAARVLLCCPRGLALLSSPLFVDALSASVVVRIFLRLTACRLLLPEFFSAAPAAFLLLALLSSPLFVAALFASVVARIFLRLTACRLLLPEFFCAAFAAFLLLLSLGHK